MEIETIGNATLIVYEKNKPLLATDPWFDSDSAYFGSWRLSHQFPKKQREAVENSRYIFISHFHPDHLNLLSLRHCKKSTIFIAQHYGSRVEKDLRRIGFKVIALPSRKWIDIGEKTRIMLFNNELQDSALLIELTDELGEKSLFLDLNDTGGIGFENEVASISSMYKNSFYLQLHCWGDADMINLFDGEGDRIQPIAARRFPVGKDIKAGMKKFNCNVAIPFSCHHQYQRRDSFWANDYVTPVNLMSEGFSEDLEHKLLPAFQKIEIREASYFASSINPDKLEIKQPIHESNFGDDWSDLLNERQIRQCLDYFQSINTLFHNYQSIILKVGGVEHEMINGGRGKARIKFIVPKSSLIKAIRREIFDDLLIGNFMKTQIIKTRNLYNPDFTLSVAKYSDNGRVKSQYELEKYFAYYNHGRLRRDIFSLSLRKFRMRILDLINYDMRTKIKGLFRR